MLPPFVYPDGIGKAAFMNLFDVIVLLLVVFLGFSGFREGLIRGGVKLAGFLLTILAVAMFSGEITRFAVGLDGMPRALAAPVMFFVVFAALSFLFTALAEILHRTIHFTPLGAVDSALGMAFGVLKALFAAGVLALILSFLPADGSLHRHYANSRVAPKLVSLVAKTIPAATTAGVRVLKHLSPAPDAEGHPKSKP